MKCFPRGLGKGSDSALVGAWLETILANVDQEKLPVSRGEHVFVLNRGLMNRSF